MDKQKFVEVLKRSGYGSVAVENGIPTVTIAGADKAEVKRVYINVGLIAKKVGYKHSFRVQNMKEDSHGDS